MQLKNIRLELRKSSPAQVLSVGSQGRHSFETEPLWLQRNRIRARTREHLRLRTLH
jgi:hypothetical protein